MPYNGKYIEHEECIHGCLYKLHSRNLSIGIFNSNDNSFTGIRRKFTLEFLDHEIHYDCNQTYGTVKPLLFLEVSPFNSIIDFKNLTTTEYNQIFEYLKEKEEIK